MKWCKKFNGCALVSFHLPLDPTPWTLASFSGECMCEFRAVSLLVEIMIMMMTTLKQETFYFAEGNYINNFVLIICRLYHFSCSFSLSCSSRTAERTFERSSDLMKTRALVNFV